jgi:cytochrome c biogenesis DsbD-like protein
VNATRTPFVLLALLPACREADPAPATAVQKDPVRLSLLAERGAGADVELAARFEIAEGWHIYWLNAGDAGLPTKVRFEGPVGFEVGDVAWPGPEMLRSAGGIVTFGYTGRTALFAHARAPGKVAPGPAVFSVSASWLACRENCIRGRGTATATLGDSQVDRAALDRLRARLPKPYKDLGAEPTWSYSDGEMRMDLVVAGAERIEMFPLDASAILRGQTVDRSGGGAVLHARFAADKPAAPSLRGVLRVEHGGAVAYYELDVPWPC